MPARAACGQRTPVRFGPFGSASESAPISNVESDGAGLGSGVATGEAMAGTRGGSFRTAGAASGACGSPDRITSAVQSTERAATNTIRTSQALACASGRLIILVSRLTQGGKEVHVHSAAEGERDF